MVIEVEPTRRVMDDSPPTAREIRGAIGGLLSRLLKDTLDKFEASLANDRQFEVLKRQVMDRFGETDRAQKAVVTSVLVKEVRNGAAKDSDNGPG